IHFVDGKRGDHDLDVNGSIETFGGPAVLVDLIFPRVESTPGQFSGFAVSNFSAEPATLTFEARNENGALIPLGSNPSVRELEPDNQLARLASELFEQQPGSSLSAWVKLKTDNPRIGSFFQFGGPGFLDGAVAATQPGSELIFTRVFQGADVLRGQPAETILNLVNLLSEVQDVELSWIDQHGAVRVTASHSISASGFLRTSLAELFGDEEMRGGYLRASAPGGILAGFVEIRSGSTSVGIPGRSPEGSYLLYSAQLASTEGLFTSLKLINLGSSEASAILTAIGESGQPLSAPVVVQVPSGATIEKDARDLFSETDIGGTLVGSLIIQVDSRFVLGDVPFGESERLRFAASLPLQSEPFDDGVFNQVANLSNFFTGLAIFNLQSVETSVRIEVFSANGTRVGATEFTLGAGQRISRLVSEFVPASAGQAGGYVRLWAEQPVIAQLLFAQTDKSGIVLFSAVPPTALR
ncbi:MAG: hypothetical protein JSU96_00470, partial [Acidobacteriota bacterium]